MRTTILLFFIIFSASSAWAGDLKKELEAKGLDKKLVESLNPACLKAVNFDLKQGMSFWNAVWTGKGEMAVVDFLQGTKHYALTLAPMADGSCQTSRSITAYWTADCGKLEERYGKSFKKGSVKVKKKEKIYSWISSSKGTDIYLYNVPGGCVEVFREFFVSSK